MGGLTDIVITCPACAGNVKVAPCEVIAFRYRDPSRSFYQFRCPACSQRAIKPASGNILKLLNKGEVRIFDVLVDQPDRGLASIDDIFELHRELDAWGS